MNLSDFFVLGVDPSQALPAKYNYALVLLSYLVAALGGYAFLQFASRIAELRDSGLRFGWLANPLPDIGGIHHGVGRCRRSVRRQAKGINQPIGKRLAGFRMRVLRQALDGTGKDMIISDILLHGTKSLQYATGIQPVEAHSVATL